MRWNKDAAGRNAVPGLFRKNREKVFLAAYLVLYLVLTVTVACLQPAANVPLHTNPPDEHARILIPQYIYRTGTLPTGFEEEVRIPAYGFSYGIYNAAPYYLHGCAMRLAGLFTDAESTLIVAARMVNVFFGFLMAVIVYLIGKKVFSEDAPRWLFCTAVTFLPQNLFIHTYVNTDSCSMLSTALILYGLVCAYREGFHIKNCFLLGTGVALCALSYYNAYGYILAAILLCTAYFFRKDGGKLRCDYKEMLKKGLLISLIVFAAAGWYFIRSYLLYDGDFLGLATRRAMAVRYAIDSVNPDKALTYQKMGYTIGQMIKETRMLTVMYISFIGEYGSMFIVGSQWMYRFYKVFLAAGAIGILYGLSARILRALRKDRQNRAGFHKWFFHGNMLMCIVIPVVLLFYYAYTMDYQAQGRYMLPALIPVMYYTVRGIQNLANLKAGKLFFPARLVNAGYAAAIMLILFFAAHMVFRQAVPLYLESGFVI